MSKFSTLFTPAAALVLASTAGALPVPTPAAAQTISTDCQAGKARDAFGFCVAIPQRTTQQDQQMPEQQNQSVSYSAYDNMISHCGGRQWADRWGQQLDRRVRGSLSGSVFESMGSPYGRFRAQQDASCRAGEQMYNLSVQYNGWENVPEHMQESATRAWYMATQLGPQRDLERRFNQTWRNQQERLADRIFGH